MAIKVLKSGMLATLQDKGRYGYAKWGINPSGVMDQFASSVANSLVGNSEAATVLEFTFPAPQFFFEETCLVSICGADFTASLDGQLIECWRPLWIQKGSTLHFKKRSWGNWAYLALHGGFQASSWLESDSTHLKLAIGGYEGRALKIGDLLKPDSKMQIQSVQQRSYNWFLTPTMIYNHDKVGVLQGAAFEQLNADSQNLFLHNSFSIGTNSDRMGYYLSGPILQRNDKDQLLSKAVNFGTIQLLPNGRMVALMADHQTTGGYPCIAHIAQGYRPFMVQQPPGSEIRFKVLSQVEAETANWVLQERLSSIRNSCYFKLQEL